MVAFFYKIKTLFFQFNCLMSESKFSFCFTKFSLFRELEGYQTKRQRIGGVVVKWDQSWKCVSSHHSHGSSCLLPFERSEDGESLAFSPAVDHISPISILVRSFRPTVIWLRGWFLIVGFDVGRDHSLANTYQSKTFTRCKTEKSILPLMVGPNWLIKDPILLEMERISLAMLIVFIYSVEGLKLITW